MPCPNCGCTACLPAAGPPALSVEFPPPPSELITTNRAPTGPEVAYSQGIIDPAAKRVSMIQALIDDLERRKSELLGLVAKHKAAISPLKSFPPELLVEIFAQCAVVTPDHPYSARHPPPLTLMGVCSRWRRIVLDAPRLWTRISTAHPMTDSWISRSKPLPLYVELNLNPIAPVLQPLIRHSHRWEYADLYLGPSSYPVLRRMKARLQSLKRLDLFFGYITGTINFCEVAPRLTEVKLMGIYRPVTIRLPWEQLRVCTLDNTEVAFYVLQHAENLLRLHLDLSNLPEGPPVSEELMMPSNPFTRNLRLNVLIMEWSFMDTNLNFFFFSVTLPALRTLKIRFDYPDSEDVDERADIDDDREELDYTLRKFFERSCAHLETLELIDIPFSQMALIDHLRCLPSLSSLDIQFDSRWYTIDETLLCQLDVNRPRHLLPRLRSLSLRGLVNIASIEEPLGILIASRRHINPEHHEVALLENLTLECDFLQPELEHPQFQRFVSEGLNITYRKGVGT